MKRNSISSSMPRPNSAPPEKARGRRTDFTLPDEDEPSGGSSSDMFNLLMSDPKKRAMIMQLLHTEKDAIEEYKRKEREKRANTNDYGAQKSRSVTPLAKMKTPRKLESPIALMRRRKLELLERAPSTSSTSSSCGPVTPIPSPSPTPSPPMPLEAVLDGVFAFVDVRSKNLDRSGGVKALLKKMGATVLEEFTSKVTHVIFKDGTFTTYQKAALLKKRLVSVLWLEAIRTSGKRVPERDYPALGRHTYTNNTSILCEQLQAEYQDIVQDELRKAVPGQQREETSSSTGSYHSTEDIIPNSQSSEVTSVLSHGSLVLAPPKALSSSKKSTDNNSLILCDSDPDSVAGVIDGHSFGTNYQRNAKEKLLPESLNFDDTDAHSLTKKSPIDKRKSDRTKKNEGSSKSPMKINKTRRTWFIPPKKVMEEIKDDLVKGFNQTVDVSPEKKRSIPPEKVIEESKDDHAAAEAPSQKRKESLESNVSEEFGAFVTVRKRGVVPPLMDIFKLPMETSRSSRTHSQRSSTDNSTQKSERKTKISSGTEEDLSSLRISTEHSKRSLESSDQLSPLVLSERCDTDNCLGFTQEPCDNLVSDCKEKTKTPVTPNRTRDKSSCTPGSKIVTSSKTPLSLNLKNLKKGGETPNKNKSNGHKSKGKLDNCTTSVSNTKNGQSGKKIGKETHESSIDKMVVAPTTQKDAQIMVLQENFENRRSLRLSRRILSVNRTSSYDDNTDESIVGPKSDKKGNTRGTKIHQVLENEDSDSANFGNRKSLRLSRKTLSVNRTSSYDDNTDESIVGPKSDKTGNTRETKIHQVLQIEDSDASIGNDIGSKQTEDVEGEESRNAKVESPSKRTSSEFEDNTGTVAKKKKSPQSVANDIRRGTRVRKSTCLTWDILGRKESAKKIISDEEDPSKKKQSNIDSSDKNRKVNVYDNSPEMTSDEEVRESETASSNIDAQKISKSVTKSRRNSTVISSSNDENDAASINKRKAPRNSNRDEISTSNKEKVSDQKRIREKKNGSNESEDDLDSSVSPKKKATAESNDGESSENSNENLLPKMPRRRKLYNSNHYMNELLKQTPEKAVEREKMQDANKTFKQPNPVTTLRPQTLTMSVKKQIEERLEAMMATTSSSDDSLGILPAVKKKPAKKPATRKVHMDSQLDEQTDLIKEFVNKTQTRSQVSRSQVCRTPDDSLPIKPRLLRRSTLDFVVPQSASPKKSQRSGSVKRSIVCTRFHRKDVLLFQKIVRTLGGFAVENTVTSRTTHLVAAEPQKTVNILRAMARGIWVLRSEWLYSSFEHRRWLPEEEYELTEFSPAIRQSRLERQTFGKQYSMDVFRNCGSIYVSRNTNPQYSELEELIKLCHGKLASAGQNADICVGEHLRFKNIKCVSEMWVLDSVSAYKCKEVADYLVEPPRARNSEYF